MASESPAARSRGTARFLSARPLPAPHGAQQALWGAGEPGSAPGVPCSSHATLMLDSRPNGPGKPRRGRGARPRPRSSRGVAAGRRGLGGEGMRHADPRSRRGSPRRRASPGPGPTRAALRGRGGGAVRLLCGGLHTSEPPSGRSVPDPVTSSTGAFLALGTRVTEEPRGTVDGTWKGHGGRRGTLAL